MSHVYVWMVIAGIACASMARGQTGAAHAPATKSDPKPRHLNWKGASGGSAQDPANWSLLNKKDRTAREEQRKAGESIPPDPVETRAPAEQDVVHFESDAEIQLMDPLRVGSVQFDDHVLRAKAAFDGMPLEVQSFSLGANPGGELELASIVFSTEAVSFGDAAAFTPDAPRNKVRIHGSGTWKANGAFSFGAGDMEIVSGALECDSMNVTGQANLKSINGSIRADTMIALGPMTSGRATLTGGKLAAPTILLTSGGSGELSLGGVQAEAGIAAEVLLEEGLDASVSFTGGSLTAPAIRVLGEGRAAVNLQGTMRAGTVLRVSAGSLNGAGLRVRSGGTAHAPDVELFQGVIEVEPGAELVGDTTVTVDEGILRLSGGKIQGGELRLMPPDPDHQAIADWPARFDFRTQPGPTPESIDAALRQDPRLAQGLAAEWLRVITNATTQAASLSPEKSLLSSFVNRPRTAKGNLNALLSLASEFQAQQDALHRNQGLPENPEEEQTIPHVPTVFENSGDLARLLAVLAKADGDVRDARSLEDIGRVMGAATDRLNKGQPVEPIPPGPAINDAFSSLLTMRFGGPARPSILEGHGVINATVTNAAVLRPGELRPGADSLTVNGDYRHRLTGSIVVRVDGSSPPAMQGYWWYFWNATGLLRVNGSVSFDQPLHYLAPNANAESVADAFQASFLGTDAAGASAVRIEAANAAAITPGLLWPVIVSSAPMKSRPARFADARIPGNDRVFLGLDRWTAQGDAISLPGADRVKSTLRVMSLRVPLVLHVGDDGKSISATPLLTDNQGKLPPKLVLVTHGTQSSTEPQNYAADPDGLYEVAVEMARFARKHGLDEWRVAIFDWREFATGPDDTHGSPVWNPIESARIGREIGASLADLILDGGLDYSGLRELHLLSHSSGTWLIDGVAARLCERSLEFGPAGMPHLQLTAFDAFLGPEAQLGSLSPSPEVVSEQYLDGRVPGTRGPHPFGPSIDCVWLDSDLPYCLKEDHLQVLALMALIDQWPGTAVSFLTSTVGQVWQRVLRVSPVWRGAGGKQVNPFFRRREVHGINITPTMTSSEVLTLLHQTHPEEAFRYAPLDLEAVSAHSWPYRWYAATICAPDGRPSKWRGSVWCENLCWQRWGFVTSPMYKDYLARTGAAAGGGESMPNGVIRVLPQPRDCSR